MTDQPNTHQPGDAPLGPDARHRAFLEAGQLMLQRSRSTGETVFYPRIAVPGSGETDLEWVPASGYGIVYATTTVQRRHEQGGPYNIALVDLAEGVRCMSRIEGIPSEAVRIGLRVSARIDRVAGTAVLVFVPTPAGGDADGG